jgi:GntR family transcriptional regulator, transcriptional repressor for pyruvate dehydrogenase complex
MSRVDRRAEATVANATLYAYMPPVRTTTVQASALDHSDTAEVLDRRIAALKHDRVRLSRRVADVVARSILEGELGPGDRLPPEKQMVEQFGLGRATIREALRLLESDGLLRMAMGPNGGPVVSSPEVDRVTRILLLYLTTSGATLRDIYLARLAIEPETTRFAATAASDSALEQLAESVERLRGTVYEETGDFLRENALFHRLVAENCGNALLRSVYLAMLDIIDGQGVGIRYSPKSRRMVVDLHREISDAIQARDPDAAAAAGAHHANVSFSNVQRRYPHSLDERLRPATLYIEG